MQPRRNILVGVSILLIALLVCGCSGSTPTAEPSTAAPSAIVTEAPVLTEPPATPTAEPLNTLPAEPQAVTFTNSAGVELQGYYYPAAVNPAPLVVLMHWPNGDMSDWYEIAVWLQNRGLVNPFTNPMDEAWWDEGWFPAVPDDRSYGVFIFSFSNSHPFSPNPESPPDMSGWLDDAQSAMLKALELEGVDPTRIIAIGSIHGGDGAIDGCLYLNQKQPGACAGALSLSPGSYLQMDYPETVAAMVEVSPDAPVWCIGMEYEIAICEYAAEQGNSQFNFYKIPGTNSGNLLLQAGLDPLPMQIILDFLEEATK